MQVLPAIDLREGRVVRLEQGRLEDETIYRDDPEAVAQEFVDGGAGWIHVVDLDGAFAGTPHNTAAIKAILRSGARVQLGGGLRDLTTVDAAIDAGVERVILGTAAVRSPEVLEAACARYPGLVLVSLDARGTQVAVDGWVRGGGASVDEVALRARDAGVAGLVYTDISRDGMGTGVNVEATARLAEQVGVPVIASGGVRDEDDLAALAERSGIEGAIVGRAIYEGTVDLASACARWSGSRRLFS